MLKIDVAFLKGLETNSRTRNIVASVVDMAKKLGIQTLAEGVETEGQYQFLRSIGCEMVQGYYFAKPQLMSSIDKLLAKGALAVESNDVAAYFDEIGKINFLSPTPFDFMEEHSFVSGLTSIIPLGIVEHKGDDFSVAIANDAFIDIFDESNIADVTGGDIVFTAQGAKLAFELQKLAQQAKETGKEVAIDFSDYNQAFSLRAVHIAETSDRDAFLVSIDYFGGHFMEERARNIKQHEAEATDRMVYLPTAQDTPWQMSDEINLGRTAVVVIDVNGGTEGIAPGLEDMADKCVQIVKAARAASVPVIFCHDCHVKGVDHELELWGEHGMSGTQSSLPLAEFEVSEADYLVPKHYYNSFYKTNLQEILTKLGVDTLIMVGMDTNICVLQTLAGAYYLGYKTIVPADATATFLVGTQKDGLDYFARCYDTRIVTTSDVLRHLTGEVG